MSPDKGGEGQGAMPPTATFSETALLPRHPKLFWPQHSQNIVGGPVVKFIFIEHQPVIWYTDLFFKKNYRPVAKDHCPSILRCSSKGKKSIKMSASAGKTEDLFYRTPPSGCLLSVETLHENS